MPQVSSSKLALSRKAAKPVAVSEAGAGGFGYFVFGDELEGEGGHGEVDFAIGQMMERSVPKVKKTTLPRLPGF